MHTAQEGRCREQKSQHLPYTGLFWPVYLFLSQQHCAKYHLRKTGLKRGSRSRNSESRQKIRLETRLSQLQQPIASEKLSFADLCNCSAAQALRMLPALRGCRTARLTRSPPGKAGSALRGCRTARLTRSPPDKAGSRPSRMPNSSAHPIPAG